MCFVQSQHKGNHKGGGAAEGRPPPLWRRPKAALFVLAVKTGHILVLRRKTCALMRARTSALLRRKACAVVRARTCTLFRTNTKLQFFLRFPTFCSASQSPKTHESDLFDISDFLFCAQESRNSPKRILFEISDVLLCAQESQNS